MFFFSYVGPDPIKKIIICRIRQHQPDPHQCARKFRPPPLQTVSHLNWLSALPSYEGRAAAEGVK
jgi:hypothetical protein